MADRITNKDLEYLVNELNKVTGNAEHPYTYVEGKYTANIGNYHISGAYGGVALEQIVTDGGGTKRISNQGYGTKRELYNFLQAYLSGIHTAKRAA